MRSSFSRTKLAIPRKRLRGNLLLIVLLGSAGSLASRASADYPVSGDVTLNFAKILDGQGNTTGYAYGGADISLTIANNHPIIVDTSIATSAIGRPALLWSDDFNWNNGLAIQFVNSGVIAKALFGDAKGDVSVSDNADAIDVLKNTGPTEKTISVAPVKITLPDIPGFELDPEVGVTFKFNVTIPTSAHVVMDQTAVLEKLTVNSGGYLTGNSQMIVRTDLVNHGFFGNLSGSVQGDFYNDGDMRLGNRADISGQMLVQGQLYNTGEIRIGPQGSLSLSSTTANAGLLRINGSISTGPYFINSGQITLEGGTFVSGGYTLNTGVFQWQSGSLVGLIDNNGEMDLSSDGDVTLFGPLAGGSTLNNLPSGVIDFTADASVINSHTIQNYPVTTINNSGIFRKSGGTGQSDIGRGVFATVFNNTGIVEVDSGTLSFNSGGVSTNGQFIFSNGGRARLGGGFVLSGLNSASGKGTLEASAVTIPRGTVATIGGFSKGAILDISSGLSVSGTLMLDVAGTSEAKLSGSLGGDGIVNNLGNLHWMAGGLVGIVNNTGNITLSSNGDVTLFGPLAGGSTLNNLPGGTIDLTADASVINSHTIQNYPVTTINNSGIFRKSGGTGQSDIGRGVFATVFNNTGIVEVDSGTLSLNSGGVSSNGQFIFSNGGSARLGGGFVLAGVNTVAGNGILEANAIVVPNGTVATIGGVTGGTYVDITGGLSVGGTLMLNMPGASEARLSGALGGSGITDNLGNLHWLGGTMIGSIKNDGSIILTSGGDVYLYGALGTGSTLNNSISGIIDISADQSIVNSHSIQNYSITTINNAGMFRKRGGMGESDIGRGVFATVFNNTGTVEADSGILRFSSGFIQTAGLTDLRGGDLSFGQPAQLLGGELLGSGTIHGSVLNRAVVSPGHSPGTIIITDDYDQEANGALVIQLGGRATGEYDSLIVEGNAMLGGSLQISLVDGFVPRVGDSFRVLSFGSRMGSFDSLWSDSGYTFATIYDSSGLSLLTVAVPEPSYICCALLFGMSLLPRRCSARRSRERSV